MKRLKIGDEVVCTCKHHLPCDRKGIVGTVTGIDRGTWVRWHYKQPQIQFADRENLKIVNPKSKQSKTRSHKKKKP